MILIVVTVPIIRRYLGNDTEEMVLFLDRILQIIYNN